MRNNGFIKQEKWNHFSVRLVDYNTRDTTNRVVLQFKFASYILRNGTYYEMLGVGTWRLFYNF